MVGSKVLRLEVAVEHLAVVHMLHGEAELHEVVEHLVRVRARVSSCGLGSARAG